MKELTKKNHYPKPGWLKTKIPSGENFFKLKKNLEERNLHTICQDAKCPNIDECWNKNHATFLIMGNICSRNCLFCSVNNGICEPLDRDEPAKIAEMAEILKLKYVVITSVTRDDLHDGGSSHYADVIKYLKERFPDLKIEVLIPDFKGYKKLVDIVLTESPDVLNHNLETVKRLYPFVNRKTENYSVSLSILKHSSSRQFITKSGIMVGLGETKEELRELLSDLRGNGVDLLTIGQYLQPAPKNLKVVKYYTPEEFEELSAMAESYGFTGIESGPFIRSSYNAFNLYKKAAGYGGSLSGDSRKDLNMF